VQSLNPFRPLSQEKPHAVPDERPSNPIRSPGCTLASGSDNTTEDAPIFIGVVGVTGSGKSSLINRVTGCDDVAIFHGLKSGNGFGARLDFQADPYDQELTVSIKHPCRLVQQR
jgi:hypothetical protein